MEIKNINKAESLIKEFKELKSILDAFKNIREEYPPYINFITERIGFMVWNEIKINKNYNDRFISVVKQIISELETELEKL